MYLEQKVINFDMKEDIPNIQGVPKKRTFRIIILQAAALGRSGSRRLKYDLPEAAACRMMILKVHFFLGHSVYKEWISRNAKIYT